MKEADDIVLFSLRQIGCDIPASVVSLREFDGALILHACAKCLAAIGVSTDLPSTLPAQSSRAFRIGETLAAALKDLGYTHEIGYQNILYPTVQNTRQLFSWLIEQLPRTDEAAGAPAPAAAAQASVAAAVAEAVAVARDSLLLGADDGAAAPRLRAGLRADLLVGAPAPGALRTREEEQFAGAHLRFLSAQVYHAPSAMASISFFARRKVAQEKRLSLLGSDLDTASAAKRSEALGRGMATALRSALASAQGGEPGINGSKATPLRGRRGGRGDAGTEAGSRFKHAAQFAGQDDDGQLGAPDKTEEEREAELDALQRRIRELEDAIAKRQGEMTAFGEQERSDASAEQSELERLRKTADEHRIKKQVFDMASNLQENLAKLREISAATAQRLIDLGQQWEDHRVPLLQALRKAQLEHSTRHSRFKELQEKRDRIRDEMRAMIVKAREKEALVAQLLAELEKLPKDLNRNTYTFRILEIIKNVKKQQIDIDRILIDIHNIRKDINSVSDTLERSFRAAEDLVYRDVRDVRKSDENAKEIYKRVVAMHQKFQKLVEAVQESGRVITHTRELEHRAEQLSARVAGNNLDRVVEDLRAIRAENKELAAAGRAR